MRKKYMERNNKGRSIGKEKEGEEIINRNEQ
jgi:hypothetical protein